MSVQSSKFSWKKQLIMLLVFVVIVGGLPAIFAPQVAKAATDAPGVGGELISWVEMNKSTELGANNGTILTQLQDLADGNRIWVPYQGSRAQSVADLGEVRINFHNVTVPASPGATVQFKTNFPQFADPASGEREVFSVQIGGTGGFPWELGGTTFSTSSYQNSLIRTHFGSSTQKSINNPSVDVTIPHILNVSSKTNDWRLSLNGYEEAHEVTNTVLWGNTGSASGYHYIGAGHSQVFRDGHIAEVLVYNRKLNDTERLQVNSYLALKYGLTLQDAAGAPANYLASDGTTKMWTASDNVGYGQRITGIGRDDTGALGQKQSKSQAADANVTIALGNEIEASNIANTNTITNDKAFFTFSDNNLAADYTTVITNDNLPAGSSLGHTNSTTKTTKKMDRVYKVDKSSNWANVPITLQVDGANATDYALYLYVSLDPTFASGVTVKATDLSTGKVTLNSDQFPDGSYFTFVKHVDKKALETSVNGIDAEGLLEADYSISSWTAFEQALLDAKSILEDADKTAGEVASALTALEAARDALANKAALQAKADEINEEITAGTLIAADYTAVSWQALQDALDTADVVLNDPNATQQEINDAKTALETARDGLVSKGPLQAKVDEINGEALVEAGYTPESWQSLQDALDAADVVLSKPDATHQEINDAKTALEVARSNLVVKGAELDSLDIVNAEDGSPIDLEPVFDGNKYLNYKTVSNAVYGVGITPDTSNPASTVKLSLNGEEVDSSGWGNLPLKEGLNVVEVEVTAPAPDGSKNVYTIEIYRLSSKLVSLTPSSGSLVPAFDSDIESYAMTVTNSVYELQWTPVTLDPTATIEMSVNGGAYEDVTSGTASPMHALNVGENTVVFKVTDQDGAFREYTIIVTREKAATSPGGGSSGGGGGSPGPSNPADIITSVDGDDVPFATGTTEQSGDHTETTVQIDADKLTDLLSDGEGHQLAIHVPNDGAVAVEGLTAALVKQLTDTGSSLEVSNLLAIYPVPGQQLDLSSISKQWDNAPLEDIAVHIDIRRSPEALIDNANSKAKTAGYELLVAPVDLDMTFTHDGESLRVDQLSGYAPRYIALPEGIDPNRITTGVIVNPDGTVFHVPTVVTKINNRYFALINDLRSHGSYSVIWNPQDFDDVKNHWARADVNNIAARLDLAGTGINTFSPNRMVNRSEFATIVATGLGLMRQDVTNSLFDDVAASSWYHNAVSIANEFAIVAGYDDGMFRGEQQITREQGFAMIARAYRLIEPQSKISQADQNAALAKYKDAADVSKWAMADVAQMIAAGIIQGDKVQQLNPQTNMTRAEATALIARLLQTTQLID